MKNQVIKVLNRDHGAKVIAYWKSLGVIVTDGYKGACTEADRDEAIYYGVIGGSFSNYGPEFVERYNAEIIELPVAKTEFKTGDYVVLLSGDKSSTLLLNHVYRVREDHHHIKVVVSLDKTVTGSVWHPFNKSKKNDWRYATQAEIDAYEEAGKPIDVRTLSEPDNRTAKELAFAELENGVYYTYHYKSGVGEPVIGKSKGKGCVTYYGAGGKSKEFFPNGCFGAASYMTKASQADIDWLEACRKAGRYVKRENVEKSSNGTISIRAMIPGKFYTRDIGTGDLDVILADGSGHAEAILNARFVNDRRESGIWKNYSLGQGMVREAEQCHIDWFRHCEHTGKFISHIDFQRLAAQVIKHRDFIKGIYYTVKYGGSGNLYVTKCGGPNAIEYCSSINSHFYDKDESKYRASMNSTVDEIETIRVSTKEEIAWLELCRANNKWTPFPKLPVEESFAQPVFDHRAIDKQIKFVERYGTTGPITTGLEKLFKNPQSLFLEEEKPMELGIKKKSKQVTTINF